VQRLICANRIITGLRGTKRDGGLLKLQEFASYTSSSEWNESQTHSSNYRCQTEAGKAAQSNWVICSYATPSKLGMNYLKRQADHQNFSESLLRSMKYGSYAMKVFCYLLAVVLATAPVSGMAQAAQTSSQPATTTIPPTTVAPPAAAAPQATAPAVAPAPPKVDGPNYAGPVDATRYIIGPEDSLQVTVWKEPTLSGTIPVRPDGMISLVLVGDMPAAGQTPMALGEAISQRLKKYVQDPVVTVVVLGVNSQRIFLVGEVGHVGPLMLTPGMTVLQAIVSAGGLTQFASSKRIYILRTVAGKQEKMPFNYKQALKGENLGVSLLPGDTIVVP
jgi:polysaccharide export outer membrane protein